MAEVLCGYKFYRARKQLCSPMARGVRAREARDRELVSLHGAIKSLEAEPGVRRNCREIGAREYLAMAANAEARKEQGHLARAATGATVALLIYSRTDVIGALRMLAGFIGMSGEPMRIVILSDMRQSSPELNLESPQRIVVGQAMEAVKRGAGLPKLDQSEIFLLGVDPSNKTAAYMAALREFWTDFFSAAGAEVRVVTATRRVPAW